MKNVVILGSTGSIGINTLKVIDQNPGEFRVLALSAYNNVDLLARQIKKYAPKYVAVKKENRERFAGGRARVLDVENDLEFLVSLKAADIVMIAMRGSAALAPFLAAAKAGKIITPANKEALVIAGEMIMREARRNGAMVVPVDSEQSAIFQCLEGHRRSELKRVLLTASGGALLNVSRSRFKNLTVHQILKHPRWKMGKKITVDSATMMNKGFEIIEAMRLFDLRPDQIEVVIHPQAIVHSMVEYKDGSVIAQLSATDMRLPIQYAMSYPNRFNAPVSPLDFFKIKRLDFAKPDIRKFPALELCREAALKGGTLPSVLNAADEEAVEAFLGGKISFCRIYDVVAKITRRHRMVLRPTLSDVFAADEWARCESRKVMAKL